MSTAKLDPSLVRHAKSAIKRLALRGGVLVRKLPAGRQGDPFADQAALLRGAQVRTIFDVGSYVGETAQRYRRLFPSAEIHCFEPVAESYQRLSSLLAGDSMMRVNRLAVSADDNAIEIHVNQTAATSSTLRPSSAVGGYLSRGVLEEVVTERVNSTTLDRYCKEHRIEQIDILKLDIQGAELNALKGASKMLSRGSISLIYTELLIASVYEGQAGIDEILSLCRKHGYAVFGLYDFAYAADGRLLQLDAILTR